MAEHDLALHELVAAIVAGDGVRVARLLAVSPVLATASFKLGATRKEGNSYFLDSIKRYIYAGDTALHIAAAAYHPAIVRTLVAAGANVHASNRRGAQPLHAAALGSPGSSRWNPSAQAETIICLIESGADPSAQDKLGATPLHKAVRSRCAQAVRTLLERGSDPVRRNTSGSPPVLLAVYNTGRGGTGSTEAKSEQREILRLLQEHGQVAPNFK